MTLPEWLFKPSHTLYLIRSRQTGRVYVGCTKYPEMRWTCHKSLARRGISTPLYDAMRAEGIDNFDFIIISRGASHNDHSLREADLIIEMSARPEGVYNRYLHSRWARPPGYQPWTFPLDAIIAERTLELRRLA